MRANGCGVLAVSLLMACSRPAPVAAPAPAGGEEPAPVSTTTAPAAQQPGGLSAEEQAIVAAVEQGNDAALALLERTVNINSGTLNLAGVKKVGQLFAAELEALGFQTRWVDLAEVGRAGHLVAERAGTGPKVVLLGHLDTVFEPDSPFQRFERVGEHAARGPGVIDMKGGNVILVAALRALAATGGLDGLHLVVVLTGDEEVPGKPLATSRAALIEAARGADYAIGFEDGDGKPETAVIGRRSASGWSVRVTGTPAHGSQIFSDEIGYGAAFELARILDDFREQLAAEAHLTFNPGLVYAGTQVERDGDARVELFGKHNVVAEHAAASGEMRALTREQIASTQERMRAIVAASLPGTRAEIHFAEGNPPLAPTDGNRRLLALYDRASRDVGAGPVTAVNPDNAGAADISFLSGVVPMVIDGVGLMGTGGHTVDETADLRTLPSQTKRIAVLLHRLRAGAAAAPLPAAQR